MKKFFRLFLVAALLPLFFACEKEPGIGQLPEPKPQTDLHKIPVEKALAELNTLLEAIDGPQTRSGTARRVESVKSLRAADLARATRTEKAEHTDIGDLVYIANFENGEGYAILGADDRIESVIAITEQGSLTPQQLTAAANGEYDGVEAPPVIPEVADYLLSNFGPPHFRDSVIGGTGSNISDLVMKEGRIEFLDRKGPYCQMKWGQDTPYNNSTPIAYRFGKHCVVGCVAVALGQIIATEYYNKYYARNMNPEPQILGGRTIHWDVIFREIKGTTILLGFPDIMIRERKLLIQWNALPIY